MAGAFDIDPIETEPAYRVAARALRAKIVRGELPVGSILPSEHAMAALLRVNRSTVREAIRLLEENGVVARKPGGKKLFVTAPPAESLSSRMTTAMILHRITVAELWEAMLAFEPAVARAAATRATDAQIAALEENLAETAGCLEDRKALGELDAAFHHLVAESSGNRVVLLSRQPIATLFYPACSPVLGSEPAGRRLLEAHSFVVSAIKNRDADVAESWMRKHVIDFRRGCERADLALDKPIAAVAAESPI